MITQVIQLSRDAPQTGGSGHKYKSKFMKSNASFWWQKEPPGEK